MIWTVVRAALIALRRDRVAQMMAFLVPMVFFSIFASVFGDQSRGTSRIRIAVVDEDRTEFSGRVARALAREPGLRVWSPGRRRWGKALPDSLRAPLDRRRARELVRHGEVPVAVVLPAGLQDSYGRFDSVGARVQLLADKSDPIAPQVVMGLLQKTVMTAAPSFLVKRGIGQFERYTGGLTPQQRAAVGRWLPQIDSLSAAGTDSAGGRAGSDTAAARSGASASGMLPVDIVDVMSDERKSSVVSFYAAGIAVMFLLFSASAAGGTLLDEADSGTLERVLSSRLGMNGLLLGKWIYIVLLGCLQITVMFVWGMLAFKLDLLSHLPGFALMTVFTAAAAAGLGLVLATASRSRQQLAGMSTLVILTMSALGGSMFPRFLMSPAMQNIGLCTFNAWALDGYIKVFWRDARPWELWPQLAVLGGITVVFLGVARALARRWECA
jgi:ABC-2 type transport system permease protein